MYFSVGVCCSSSMVGLSVCSCSPAKVDAVHLKPTGRTILPQLVGFMALAGAQAADLRGWTGLHHAAHQGKDCFMLRGGKEARTVAGNTPLHLAAKAGHAKVLRDLISPTTLDAQNNQGFTPLQLALLHKQWEAAAVLVAAGASTQGPDAEHSITGLGYLPEDGAPDAPLQLVKAWLADPSPTGLLAQAIHWRDAMGSTALHVAASSGNVEGVRNLLRAGADIHTVDADGCTPLQLAQRSYNGHALAPLLDPATSSLEMYGTPLHVAADKGDAAAVAAQLAAGAQPDSHVPGGTSILAVAAQQGHTQVVTVLLSALGNKYGKQEQQDPQQQAPGSSKQQKGPQKQLQAQHKPDALPGPADAARQQGHGRLVEVVAAAVASLATRLEDTTRCSQLLGVVLEVLGPELAGEVCVAARQQVVRGHNSMHRRTAFSGTWSEWCSYNHQYIYLAEPLLLGWLGAEGRRLVPARLQRLVPGVGAAATSQQQQEQQMQQQRQTQRQWSQTVELKYLVSGAVVEAASGQQQEANAMLAQCAERCLQLPGASSTTQGPNDPAPGSFPSLQGRSEQQVLLPCPAPDAEGGPSQQAGPMQGSVPPPWCSWCMMGWWEQPPRRMMQAVGLCAGMTFATTQLRLLSMRGAT